MVIKDSFQTITINHPNKKIKLFFEKKIILELKAYLVKKRISTISNKVKKLKKEKVFNLKKDLRQTAELAYLC